MEHHSRIRRRPQKDLIASHLDPVPDRPGIAPRSLATSAAANIVVDDIIQNVMDDNTAKYFHSRWSTASSMM